MSYELTVEREAMIAEHVAQLSKSDKGLSAMHHVLGWMDDEGLSLDGRNKVAILGLIELCWKHPGSTRDAMRDALEAV